MAPASVLPSGQMYEAGDGLGATELEPRKDRGLNPPVIWGGQW